MYLTQLCCIFTTTNTMKIIFKKYSFLLVFITLFTTGCSSLKEKGEEDIIKKETPNPNMRERILSRESVGIFDSARSRMGGTSYEFATSNVLWRASLQSLKGMPIASANYSGGVLISDWIDSEEVGSTYKIQINFKSNELAVSSLDVQTFLKKCSSNYTNCKLSTGSEETSAAIKNKILNTARSLTIAEEKNKKK
jgi:hypothetical protein